MSVSGDAPLRPLLAPLRSARARAVLRTLRLAGLVVLAGVPLARAQEPELVDKVALHAQIVALKKIEISLMHEGASRRFARARKYAEAQRALQGKPAPRRPAKPGTGAKPATDEDRRIPQDAALPPRVADPTALSADAVVPTNVRANNPATDAAGVGQAEESMASRGSNVLVAFNDGQGFVAGNPYKDSQGYAYSTNGGATFTDGGVPPKPAGYPAWVWTSDPVVSVNEKTNKFYYLGQASSDATHNAIGLVAGSFSGASFVWDSARVVRIEANVDYFLDKPWMVADSSSGNVYVSWTTFDATTPANWIDFTRSTNVGRTWSTPMQISNYETDGLVQASRPVMGPAGVLYVTWQAIGDTIEVDYLKFTRSLNQGVAFDPEVTPVSYIPNFGTGAPGYNREFGVHFPDVAVDRVGTNRGRIYLAWNESYNHLNDVFIPTGNRSEVEPNNAYASAMAFTPGETLRGNFTTANDQDYWKVTLAKAQRIVLWVDSLVTNETYVLRVFAPTPDSLQRLCYGGDLVSTPGDEARETYYTFAAPAAGTYFVRIGPAFPTSVIGNYRLKTKTGEIGTERGRDQRDAFVCTSTNGTTWSAPTRVNNNPIGNDDYLAQIAVGSDGCLYAMWRDNRDDVYGSRTHMYMSRSIDNATTWATGVPITSAQGNFTVAQTNLLPNQGDYNALIGDDRYVRAAWADARSTTVDVWGTAIDTDMQITKCPNDTVTHAGSQVWATYRLANLNPLFRNRYVYTMTSQRNWPMPTDSFEVAAGTTAAFIPRTTVPDTAKAGVNRICLNLRHSRGTKTVQCCFNVTVIPGAVDVVSTEPAAFALAPVAPNPARSTARLTFTLPRAVPVTLRVYGLAGELVRTLAEGPHAAGTHEVRWDGHDRSGRLVGPGVYFVHLEAPGQSAVRRMVWLR